MHQFYYKSNLILVQMEDGKNLGLQVLDSEVDEADEVRMCIGSKMT